MYTTLESALKAAVTLTTDETTQVRVTRTTWEGLTVWVLDSSEETDIASSELEGLDLSKLALIA